MKMKAKIKTSVLTVALLLSTGLVHAQATGHEDGMAIVKGSDCFTCHRVGQKLIGPSYKDVALKYKGADDAKITELANKVIAGGTGNWGAVAMRAHPTMSVDDAKKAVVWILSLADAPAAGTEAAPAAPAAAPAPAPAPATH